MICKLCQTEYQGTSCPYCGLPALGELDGGASDKFCEEYRQKLVARLETLQAVAYRYEQTQDGIRESEETVVLADLSRADRQMVWSEAEFLHLEPGDLESGEDLILTLKVVGQGFERAFTAALPLPEAEGLWRVGVRLEADMTLTVAVGVPDRYSAAMGIRFLQP